MDKTFEERIKKLKAGVGGLLDRISDKSEPYFKGQAVGLNYVKEIIDINLPELNESDDERIRKKIVSAICYYRNDSYISEDEFAACRSWLEKQKEQPQVADASKMEQPEAIGGVVHHALNDSWIVVNQEQLSARLKQFPEGTEVEVLINARKEK